MLIRTLIWACNLIVLLSCDDCGRTENYKKKLSVFIAIIIQIILVRKAPELRSPIGSVRELTEAELDILNLCLNVGL
jgi:hypothetical protein